MNTRDAHSQGQKDGSTGKYNPPIDTVKMAFQTYDKSDVAAQKSYDAGYQNGRANPSSSYGSGGSGSSSGSGGGSSSGSGK